MCSNRRTLEHVTFLLEMIFYTGQHMGRCLHLIYRITFLSACANRSCKMKINCKLQKSLHGLRQASCSWFTTALTCIGYPQSHADSLLFIIITIIRMQLCLHMSMAVLLVKIIWTVSHVPSLIQMLNLKLRTSKSALRLHNSPRELLSISASKRLTYLFVSPKQAHIDTHRSKATIFEL